MIFDLGKVEEDFDTRYVDHISNRYRISGAAHLARYYWVEKYVVNKTVLDAGCGSGYGDNILAKTSKKVVGIDISENAINYARKKYKRPNLEYYVADLTKGIDLKDKYDIVISFNVIEHINDVGKYYDSLVGALNDAGILIIETPNRLVSDAFEPSWNPFHVQELSPDELKNGLTKYFNEVQILGFSLKDKKKEEIFKKDIEFVKRIRRDSIKTYLPYWLRFIIKNMRFYLFYVFMRNKLFYVSDFEFTGEKVDTAGGIIAICKSKKRIK